MDYAPHWGQQLFHDDPHRFRVLVCGRRWGKSRGGAGEAVKQSALMEPAGVAFVIAPTYTSTSLGRCWREFLRICPRELIQDYPKGIHRTPGDRHINLIGDRIVYFKSADRPDTLAGEGLSWVWCDEPAQFHEDVWERVIPPSLIEKHGKAWFTGTPNGRNWYYRLAMEGLDPLNLEVKTFQFTSYDNPTIAAADIKSIADRLPWQARQQEIMGVFLDDVAAVFRGVDNCIGGFLQEPVERMHYVAGVDLAKHRDYTVIYVMNDRGQVVAWDRFAELDWEFQRKRLVALCKRYNARMLVDSSGVGDPVYDALRREDIAVEGYKLTNASKAELIENLSMKIEAMEIRFPKELTELTSELKLFGWTKSKGGNIIYGAPEGYHDDCVIALALATWMISKPLGRVCFV